MVRYPILIGEMAKRQIQKKALARTIGVCDKSLINKLNGRVPFTWPEVKTIRREYFPDIPTDELFATAEEIRDSAQKTGAGNSAPTPVSPAL